MWVIIQCRDFYQQERKKLVLDMMSDLLLGMCENRECDSSAIKSEMFPAVVAEIVDTVHRLRIV
jgi:hypothetical protein